LFLGSEGTIESNIYQKALSKIDVNCFAPESEQYVVIRNCIEAVKQNKYSDEVKESFCRLVNNQGACILGCTELTLLFEKYASEITCKKIYDPIELSLMQIKEEIEYD